MGAIDSGNTAWILTSASLVFLMTPGVAFFYGGMVRAKAVLNMLMLEAAALSVTMIIWTCGVGRLLTPVPTSEASSATRPAASC